MKVSVVISTYNRKDRLQRALDSVFTQTFKDFEVIVVDDGSTDGTEELCKSYDVQYKKITHFGKDTRPKNEGIKLAKGEYIAFLDDDNLWRPDHLQVLVNELDRNPEVALVYGDRWLTDEDGEIPSQLGVCSDYNPFLLMQRNYIDTSDVLVRKEALFNVGGFDETQKKYVDWNLWVRLNKYGYDFKRVPLVITDYHLHSKSKSKTVLTDREQEHFDATGQSIIAPDWDAIDCEIELPYLKEVKEPRVAIFTITYDRLDYTKACFEALARTSGYKYDHFVIDNGSSDGTQSWLMTYSEKGLHLGENKGISVASNKALDLIGDDYDIVIKLDNDCLMLNQGWLAAMVKVWKSNHRLALSCYVQGLKDNPGGSPRVVYGKIAGELIGMTRHLGGICHFVDAKAYKNWRWDETSFLHGVQDVEFSQYLTSIGYQMGYLENWFCEHMDGTEGQHEKYPDYFERRKKEKTTRYKKRANINTKEYWDGIYSKENLADPNYRNDEFSFAHIYAEIGSGKVIDAGCGNGYLLSYLEQKNRNLELYGFDLSDEGIKVARTRTKATLKQGSVLDIPFESNCFDYLTSTEVLEHIIEIEAAIKEFSRVLKVGGKALVMLPYKDFIPNAEHVAEYDEEDMKRLFGKYFSSIEVSVLKHQMFLKVSYTGEKEHSKILFVKATK